MSLNDTPRQILSFAEWTESSRQLNPVLQHLDEEPLIVAECDARGMEVQPVLYAAKRLAEAGVHGISVSDNALARLRICSVALSHRIQETAGVRAVCHKSCRDINLLGMHSLMMGASQLGVDTILAITGDKMALGEFGGKASGVFDLNSVRLVELLSSLNDGRSILGAPLPGPHANFEIAVGFNPNVFALSAEIGRLKEKIAKGAKFALSQLVFDCKVIQKMYAATEHLEIPVLVGMMPFVSLRNARFIDEKVMHGHIPTNVFERMATAKGNAAAEQSVGIAICKEQVDVALSMGAPGFYFVTPFGRVDMILELVQYVKEQHKNGSWRRTPKESPRCGGDNAAAA